MKTRKTESKPNIRLVFDFETFYGNNNAVPYTAVYLFGSKLKIKRNSDMNDDEIEKCFSHVKVFSWALSCVTFWFDLIVAISNEGEKQSLKNHLFGLRYEKHN